MTSASSSAARRIGRYELHGEFARGGMARVHLGRLVGPVGFARTVAIKCLHPGYANDPEAVRMFIDEANLASRVRHPNVVPIVDVLATDGELFLVMDYVRGASLARLLEESRARGASVPLPIALSVMSGVFAGLHAAHEAVDDRGEALGIVHRDVSPQNVLVGDDGVARLLDFGVAKAESRLHQTSAGEIKGKLAYMSPEQLASAADVDRRSDVFAGSIVLWEVLAGRKLFGRETAAATLAAMNERDGASIEAPSLFRADAPPALDALVLRGLAREPSGRPATALEFVRALEECGRLASAREVGDWVRGLVLAELQSTEALVSGVEEGSVVTALVPGGSVAPPSLSAGAPPSLPPVVAAAAPHADDDASAPVRRSRRVALGAAGLVVVVAALSALVRVGGTRASVDASIAPPATVVAPDAPSGAGHDEGATSAVPAPAPSTTALPVTIASARPPPSRATPKGGISARPAKRPQGAPSLPTDCRVLRPDGTFGYRPECLK